MDYNSEIKIGQKAITANGPTYFIADIAANHDNDIERAKALIWSAAEAGADAAKFQHFHANTIVSDFGFKSLGGKMSHQSKWDKSVYETYKDAELNINWTQILAETCSKAGIEFMTSPYSKMLVDEVDSFIPAYKIGSGDITYEPLINYISKKNKPVILACGASTEAEVTRAVDTILAFNRDLILLQCNTNYTGSLENFKFINLNVLIRFQKKYPNMLLGLSDHTPGVTTVLGAITLGARLIEKHYTDDNSRKGPDHPFSMNPKSWKEMVERSRELEAALGDGIKIIEENEKESVILQRRCMRVMKDLPRGHIVEEKDLVALRPAAPNSYSPYQIPEMLEKTLNRSKKAGDAVYTNDLN